MNLIPGILAAPFITTALAWAGVAAVGIPIAIHLLSRLRRQVQLWGAMRFLLEAYRRHRQRLRFEQWILLLLRCLVVLILAFALAGPILSGIIGRFSRGLNTTGRVIHVVIDDSLSSQASITTELSRFDRLVEIVLSFINTISESDRLVLWRCARPSEELTGLSTQGHAAMRAAVSELQPRYGRSQLPECLEQVYQSIMQDEFTADQSKVIVLSDFSRGCEYLKRNVPGHLKGLGDESFIYISGPEPGSANVQVKSTSPRRSVVLADSAAVARVPVLVQCRRFDTGSTSLSCGLEVKLLDSQGKAVSTASRTIQWSVGQSDSIVNMELPLDLIGSDLIGGRSSVHVIQVDLDPAQQPNAIVADDRNWSVVEVRQRVVVGLVDEARGYSSGGINALLRGGQWVSLALSPQVKGDPGVIEVMALQPSGIDEETLGMFDLVIVMRPDLLAGTNWQHLARFTDAGGLVWVFAPDQTSSATWSQAMCRAMRLDWQIAIEPITFEPDDDPAHDDEHQGSELDVSNTLPEALQLLATDYEILCRPVRVRKWFGIDAPSDQVWLRLDVDDELSRYAGLMAVSEKGLGEVIYFGAPLIEAWTNLPTKPVFVPLLHETIRGLLGQSRRADPVMVAGDKPVLDTRWAGTKALVPSIVASDVSGNKRSGYVVDLINQKGMLQAAAAIEWPGIYTAAESDVSRKLAVNVDADAGNCRAVSEQELARWFDGFGEGRWKFLDVREPASVLNQVSEQVNVGWPLLWLVLVLLILETILARLFSHAGITGRLSFTGRLMKLFGHLRHQQSSPSTSSPASIERRVG